MRDEILGEELSPSNTTLPILVDFVNQVSTFLKGNKRVDLSKIRTSITHGSLAVTAYNNAEVLNKAITDYAYVIENKSLDKIDLVRAKIIEEWQSAAKESETRSYHLEMDSEGKISTITIDSNTDYKTKRAVWVNVDLYLYGRIFDLGGKSKSNVHIELENGSTLKIETDSHLLAQDDENRLYKDQLVRVKAKRNIYTHELKDEQLVSFEKYSPVFDEEKFEEIAAKARIAWKNVTNVTEWIDDVRAGGGIYV